MENIMNYSELNESLFFNKYSKIQKKVTNDLKLNFYFMTTFGTAIGALYPFFDKLSKTGEITYTFTPTDIVLLTICALAIIYKESKTKIDQLVSLLKEKGLGGFIEKFKEIIQNLGNLFKNVAKTIGKSIEGIVDMFLYTALFVPFIIGLIDVIELYKINFATLEQILINPKGAAISTSIGVLTLTLKHIVNIIIKKITRKSKSKNSHIEPNDVVQSFESVDNIYNDYFRL